MKARTRLIFFLAIALGCASLPLRAAAEDIYLAPFPKPPEWYEGCVPQAFIEYNFETATFMTPFKRDDCGYEGNLQVTVTMTRHAYNKLLFQDDPPVTVTVTGGCPASQDCEFRVSMPHPNPEEASYAMSWIFRGIEPTPSGRTWVAWKWETSGCDSYVIFARCRAFGEYWVVRIPDT